ncbi:OmpA family protein [Portibacter marinus]|uniref:OmpA family protein n=1 Tax=Portibacter marinus TaxID=2898660 RepID=UPI001F236CF3|nr:OmpA family protein [Portibacter marinus]
MRNCLFIMLLAATKVFSQGSIVEGYVFEEDNRGYLNQVSIDFFELKKDSFIVNVRSDKDGFFTAELLADKQYRLEAYKDAFEKKAITFETNALEKTFLKIPMSREEGYLFEVTLAPKRDDENQEVQAITGALIEVYNNTAEQEVLVLKDHPNPDFRVNFTKGNHYTIMIRKDGYLVKRMEAFVNVEGCILCFEGVGEVRPGVADNLTEGLSMGTLLANVEMIPIYEGKIIELQNLYYEFGKSALSRKAKEILRNLADIIQDNPHLSIELGSHTDARGGAEDNLELSQKRAQAAVDFLTGELEVSSDRIVAVGYGESQIKNKCLEGVDCTEEEHAANRRTEIKILEMNQNAVPIKSLTEIKFEEQFLKKILEGEGSETIVYEKEQVEVDMDTAHFDVKEVFMETSNEVDEVDSTLTEHIDLPQNEVLDTVNVSISISLTDTTEVERVDDRQIEKETQVSPTSNDMVFLDGQTQMEAKKEIANANRTSRDTALENIIRKKKERDMNELGKDAYSGYRVVVHYSNLPIPADHKIYRTFPEILTYRTAQKNVLYMVGEFESQEEAETWKIENIEEDFPNAYVVEFVNGLRIKQ